MGQRRRGGAGEPNGPGRARGPEVKHGPGAALCRAALEARAGPTRTPLWVKSEERGTRAHASVVGHRDGWRSQWAAEEAATQGATVGAR